MGGGVEELLGSVNELLVADLLHELVDSHGGDQLLVADGGAISQSDGLVAGVDLGNLALLTEASVLLGESVGNGNPDTTGTTTGGETESSVRTPVSGGLVEDNVGGNGLDVGSSDTLTQPGALHLEKSSQYFDVRLISRCSRSTYLGGGHSPDLEVVGSHEQVGETDTHLAENPLIEGLGLGTGDTCLQGSIDQAVNALDLLLLGKHGDVVLEGVGNPLLLAADVRDTLVGVPVVLLGESLIDAVVEVLVVGENDVATNIVQLETINPVSLSISSNRGVISYVKGRRGKTYESFGGHVRGGKTTGSLVGINNQPRGAILEGNS